MSLAGRVDVGGDARGRRVSSGRFGRATNGRARTGVRRVRATEGGRNGGEGAEDGAARARAMRTRAEERARARAGTSTGGGGAGEKTGGGGVDALGRAVAELEALREELASTEEARASEASDLLRVAAMCERLESDLDAAKRENALIEASLSDARAALEARRREKEAAEADIVATREASERLAAAAREESERLKSELEQSKMDASVVENNLAGECERLAREAENASREAERLTAELESARARVDTIEADLAAAHDRFAQDAADAAREAARLRTELDDARATMHAQKNDMASADAKFASELSSLSERAEAALNESERLKSELEQSKMDASVVENNLAGECERLAREAENASREVERLTAELERASKESEHLREELSIAEANAQLAESTMAETREQLSQKAVEAERVAERLKSELDEALAELQTQKSEFDAMRADLSDQRELFSSEISAMEKRLEIAQAEIQTAEAALESQRRDMEVDFAGEREKLLQEAAKESERLEAEFKDAQTKAAAIEADLISAVERLEREAGVSQKRIEALQGELEDVRSALDKREKELVSANAKFSDERQWLTEQANAAFEEAERLKTELATVKAAALTAEADLTATCKSLSQQADRLSKETKAATSELESLRAELEKSEEQAEAVEAKLAEMCEKLEIQLEAAVKKADASASETDKLRSELQEASRAREAASDESKRLKQLLIVAKEELEIAATRKVTVPSAPAADNEEIQLLQQLIATQEDELKTLRVFADESASTLERLQTQLQKATAERDGVLSKQQESDAASQDRLRQLTEERDIAVGKLAKSEELREAEAERAGNLTKERDDAVRKLAALQRALAESKSSQPEVQQLAMDALPEVALADDDAVISHGDAVRERVRKQLTEAIRNEAIRFVEEKFKRKSGVAENASRTKDGVYYFIGDVRSSQKARVIYNRQNLPQMSRDGQVFIHVGFDKWSLGVPKKIGMVPLAADAQERNVDHRVRDQGSYVVAEFDVLDGASTVDFVFSDVRGLYDNNFNSDYHCPVTEESRSREQMIAERMESELNSKREQIDKSVRRAGERAENHERKRLDFINNALKNPPAARVYTVPHQPVAGGEVTIYYRLEGSPLADVSRIYCQGSWNRWNHESSFGPSLLQYSDKARAMKLTVNVPTDAHVMDFKFSNSDIWSKQTRRDDNNGMDYHTLVSGGSGHMPVLNVVHVAVEMAPIAKVGGMGDVVTALARATQEDGHNVEVIVPHYNIAQFEFVDGYHSVGAFKHQNVNVQVFKGWVEDVAVTLLRPENGYFDVGCIYGRGDDHVRFGFFTDAALAWMRSKQQKVDIIHAHDWQTAAATWSNYPNAATALTLHNLQFGVDLIRRGMESCDIATTVSPTYADEVRSHHAVAPSKDKFVGIRNGIDTDIWNPAVDEFLPVGYDITNAKHGKLAAAAELCKRLGLEHREGAPIVGVVSRLTAQKGIHLIKHACYRALDRGATFVLLGSAPDPAHQHEFNMLAEEMKKKYPGRSGFMFKYDEPLSHLIYAGCDFLLVPSMFEPCGLTQMIAMRYGTVPVVRRTGGLADTVFDVENDSARCAKVGIPPNGFVFDGTETRDIDNALNRGLDAYYDRERWRSLDLVSRTMSCDWSWFEPSKRYEDLYWAALRAKRAAR